MQDLCRPSSIRDSSVGRLGDHPFFPHVKISPKSLMPPGSEGGSFSPSGLRFIEHFVVGIFLRTTWCSSSVASLSGAHLRGHRHLWHWIGKEARTSWVVLRGVLPELLLYLFISIYYIYPCMFANMEFLLSIHLQ